MNNENDYLPKDTDVYLGKVNITRITGFFEKHPYVFVAFSILGMLGGFYLTIKILGLFI